MDLKDFVHSRINDIDYLANVTTRKCKDLQEPKCGEDVNNWYKNLIKLCRRLRINAETFENDLLQAVPKYEIDLDLEKSDGILAKDIIVTVKIGGKIDITEIPYNSIKNREKFEKDLRKFVLGYSEREACHKDDIARILGDEDDMTELASTQDSVALPEEDRLNISDPLEAELRAIHSTPDPHNTSHDNLENVDENLENPTKVAEFIEHDRTNGHMADENETEIVTGIQQYPETQRDVDNTQSTSMGVLVESETEIVTGSQQSPENSQTMETESDLDNSQNSSQKVLAESRHTDVSESLESSEDEDAKKGFFAQLGLSNINNYDAIKRVQKELMDVDYEVEYVENNTVSKTEKSNAVKDENMEELEEWFDQSDSNNDSTDSSDSDDVVFSEPEINEIISETKTKKISENDKGKFVMKECYVKMERMKIVRVTFNTDDEDYVVSDSSVSSSSSSISSGSNLDKEIDRLCDLSSIENPQKRPLNYLNGKLRIKRKRSARKLKNLSGSETTDLSGFDSFSEDEIMTLQHLHQKKNVEPMDLLSQIILNITSTDDEKDVDENVIDTESKKAKETRNNVGNCANKEKKETKGKDWRNDPLLNQRFDTGKKSNNTKRKQLGSDSDDDFQPPKKCRKRNSYCLGDSSSTDSEQCVISDEEENVVPEEKINSDSDCEIVDFGGAVPFDIKQEEERGRKNILPILSTESLSEETQKAGKAEEERVYRLEKKLEFKASQCKDNPSDCLLLDITPDGYRIEVDEALSKRLYPHQINGVQFMWDSCYENVISKKVKKNTGCILAHNMGLGKTFQVFTLIHTLFKHAIIGTKLVLIICPVSTIYGWIKEFKNGLKIATSTMNINVFNIASNDGTDAKYNRILNWKRKGGVLILGYEAFGKLTNSKSMNIYKLKELRKALIDPGPDLIVCDEGHLLKNAKSLRTKALMQIKTSRRIILTGTPLQNNLSEYYHMVEFVKPYLLGTRKEFNRQFGNPIMNGQYEDSSTEDIAIMKRRSHVLHRLLKYTVQRYEGNILKEYLKSMHDYALFIQLHPLQEQLYNMYLEMVRLNRQTARKKMKTFFTDYQIAKYICSHPFLLYTMETQKTQLGQKKKIIEKEIISVEPEVQEFEGLSKDWFKSICPENVKTELEFGTKLMVMIGIIEEAEKIGEKVLLFTSSLVELNSIEYFLKLKGTSNCPSWKSKRDYFRMDGTVPPCRRTEMCDLFNDKSNTELRLFLMSHKVGGLGLNLVAANRVILLGANFNPSHDLQSIYRVYRFGQDKPVYVYRLLSMGTMEEKIYNRCVSKLAIASRVVDKHQIARHYSNLDLDDLYRINVDLSLERPTLAIPNDNLLANVLLQYKCIYKYHHHEKLLENLPDEDLNEEDKIKAWEEFKMLKVKTVPTPVPTPSLPSTSKSNPLTALASILSQNMNPTAAPQSGEGILDNLMQSKINQIFGTGPNAPLDFNIMNKVNRYLALQPIVPTGDFLLINPMVVKPTTKENVNKPTLQKTKEPSKASTSRNTENRPKIVQKQNFISSRTSSDDFQKQQLTVVPVRNRPTSCITTSNIVKNNKETPGNSNIAESIIIPDDDDVILVSSPGMPDKSPSFQDTIEKLKKANVTVHSARRKSEDDDLIVLS